MLKTNCLLNICAVMIVLASFGICGASPNEPTHNALYEVSLEIDRAFDNHEIRTAEVLIEKGTRLSEKNPGLCDSADAARLYFSLAKFYGYNSRNDLADDYYKRSLALYKKYCGTSSDEYISVADRFGYNYYAMAKYAEAEELYSRNFEAIKTRYGAESEKALDYMWKMANIYNFQSKPAEAEKMCLAACALIERKFGGKHPLLIDFKRELSNTYLNAKRFDDSCRVSRDIIADAERIYGPGKYEAARACHGLAFLYYSLGNNDDATLYFRRVIAMRKAKPSTKDDFGIEAEAAKSAHNLAITLHAAGKSKEAAECYETALDAYKNVTLSMCYPAEHDQIKKVLKALSSVYRDLNMLAKAAAAEDDLREENYCRKYYPVLKPDWTPSDIPK